MNTGMAVLLRMVVRENDVPYGHVPIARHKNKPSQPVCCDAKNAAARFQGRRDAHSRCAAQYLNCCIDLSWSLVAFRTPWSGYHCSFAARAGVLLTLRVLVGAPAGGFPAGGLFDEVVVARIGSFTNLILLGSTRMSCWPIPRNPPPPTTSPRPLPAGG